MGRIVKVICKGMEPGKPRTLAEGESRAGEKKVHGKEVSPYR